MKGDHLYLATTITEVALISYTVMAGDTTDEDTLRILWLGSSTTCHHETPRDVAEWIIDAGSSLSVESELIRRSGTGVQKCLEPDSKFEYGLKPSQSALERIRAGKAIDEVSKSKG